MGGAEADWKRHQRETGTQRLQALLTNGCKKPDGSGLPSGLPPSWGGGLAGPPCAHHPLPEALSRQTTLPCRGFTQPLSASAASPPPSKGIAPQHHSPGVGWGGPCPCPSPNPGVGHTCSASSPATCHSTSDTGLADRQDKEISQCRQNLRQGLDGLTSLRSSNTRDGRQAVAGSLALCRPQLLGPGWVGAQGGMAWKCLHTVGAH